MREQGLTKSMALKATIHRATVQLADMDRQIYGDHEMMIARHPSETDERMLVRLLAFALNIPASEDHGTLVFAKDMWDPDEPALWQKDLTGEIQHWIEVGQPDDRRIMQASSRAGRATIYSFSSSASQWWSGIQRKLTLADSVCAKPSTRCTGNPVDEARCDRAGRLDLDGRRPALIRGFPAAAVRRCVTLPRSPNDTVVLCPADLGDSVDTSLFRPREFMGAGFPPSRRLDPLNHLRGEVTPPNGVSAEKQFA